MTRFSGCCKVINFQYEFTIWEGFSSQPNSAAMSVYDLVPLNLNKKEIRLLKILPGQGSEPIHVELFTTGLENQPEYIALSYAWCANGSDVIIHFGQQNISVTETLHHAILQIRDTQDTTVIWIDAICINQDSTDEKNDQVPLMVDIYTSAKAVVVWLGDSTENMQIVFDLFDYIEEHGIGKEKLEDILDNKPGPRSLLGKYLRDKTPKTSKFVKSLSCGLVEFFELRWFYRVWVLQEVALPYDEPVFYCGSHRIAWGSVSASFNLIWDFFHYMSLETPCLGCMIEYDNDSSVRIRKVSQSPFSGIQLNRKILQQRRRYSCGLDISDALAQSLRANASNGRDKVYGLLGMVCSHHNAKIEVDYRKTISEVYRDTMVSIILSRGLSMLTWNPCALDSCSPSSCTCYIGKWSIPEASWVPDFNRQHDKSMKSDVAFGGRCGRGLKERADMGIKYEVIFRGFSLFVRGILLDSIQFFEYPSWPLSIPEASSSGGSMHQHMEESMTTASVRSAILAAHSLALSIRGSEWPRIMSLRVVWPMMTEMYRRFLIQDRYNSDNEDHSAAKPEIGQGSSEEKDADYEQPKQEVPRLREAFELVVGTTLVQSGGYQPQGAPRIPFIEAVCRTIDIKTDVPFNPLVEFLKSVDPILAAILQEDYRHYQSSEVGSANDKMPTLLSIKKVLQEISPGSESVVEHTVTNMFRPSKAFVSQRGWMGQGPHVMQPGDVIAVLFGVKEPLILRPVDNHYLVVGDSYVCGIMNGELVRDFARRAISRDFEAEVGSVQASYDYASALEFELR
ncbi:HET-domain-containing protein [Hypoxylon sp. EC38]|nr:HET-domain-containing protein [Hypoxylon sp. EC38]